MDLALDVGVSTRHLSCIETGRARPSPAMLEALAGALDVPLRERNRLLLAAGYAPRYAERTLDDDGMRQVRSRSPTAPGRVAGAGGGVSRITG